MRDIMNYLNDNRIYHFRVNADMNTVGIPDIVVCHKGKFIGLEVKTETGKPSGIQMAMAKNIKDCGGECYFPTSVEQVHYLLNGES